MGHLRCVVLHIKFHPNPAYWLVLVPMLLIHRKINPIFFCFPGKYHKRARALIPYWKRILSGDYELHIKKLYY